MPHGKNNIGEFVSSGAAWDSMLRCYYKRGAEHPARRHGNGYDVRLRYFCWYIRVRACSITQQFSQAQRRHLYNANASRQRLAYAFHQVIRLRTCEHYPALLVRLIDHPLDWREELGNSLYFINNEGQALELEEQHGILLGPQKREARRAPEVSC